MLRKSKEKLGFQVMDRSVSVDLLTKQGEDGVCMRQYRYYLLVPVLPAGTGMYMNV
tara:strand:+ start:331 stop:498 length:168 start_codon:yes stop_codon:yes gene_type:complete